MMLAPHSARRVETRRAEWAQRSWSAHLRRSSDSVAAPSQQRCAHHERATGQRKSLSSPFGKFASFLGKNRGTPWHYLVFSTLFSLKSLGHSPARGLRGQGGGLGLWATTWNLNQQEGKWCWLLIQRVASRRGAQNERDGAGLRCSVAAALRASAHHERSTGQSKEQPVGKICQKQGDTATTTQPCFFELFSLKSLGHSPAPDFFFLG